MNALRTVLGTRPQRRRYLALGGILGVGALSLGATLGNPFVAATGLLTVAAALGLVALAAAAGYDGAGAPATVALVALAAAGLAPFVTVGVAGAMPVVGTLAVRAAFAAAVALVSGVALGLPGFLLGAGVRWWVESRRRPVGPSESDGDDAPSGAGGS